MTDKKIYVLYKEELRILYISCGDIQHGDGGAFWLGEDGERVFDHIENRRDVRDTFGVEYWESLEDFQNGNGKSIPELVKGWVWYDPDTKEPIEDHDDYYDDDAKSV